MGRYLAEVTAVIRHGWPGSNASMNPLYPVAVLSSLLYITGESLAAALAIQSLLGILSAFLLYGIAVRYVKAAIAFAAAFLMVVYVDFVLYDSLPLSEAAVTFLLLGSILSYLRFREQPAASKAFFFGLLWGLAIATRPNALILGPLLFLGDLVEKGRAEIGERFALLKWAVLPALALTVLFSFRAHEITGEWLFFRSGGGEAVLMGNYQGASGRDPNINHAAAEELSRRLGGSSSATERDREAIKMAAEFWWHNPGEALCLTAKKAELFLRPEFITNNVSWKFLQQYSGLDYWPLPTAAWVWPFAWLGLVLSWRDRKKWGIPLMFCCVYSIAVILMNVYGRFRLPVIPFMLLWSALGAEWLLRRLRKPDLKSASGAAFVILGLMTTHFSIIANTGSRILEPMGTVTYAENSRQVADGQLHWDAYKPYHVALRNPEAWAEKTIMLPPELLGKTSLNARLVMRIAGSGELVIAINGTKKTVCFPAGTRPELVEISLPPGSLREENKFRFSVRKKNWCAFAVDEDGGRGRSAFSPDGQKVIREHLDDATCLRYRRAHLPEGELQVALLFPGTGENVKP